MRWRIVQGYAVIFNNRSEPIRSEKHAGANFEPFIETYRPGCFARRLQGHNVRALIGHDPELEIGQRQDGTLRVRDDGAGLRVEMLLPAMRYNVRDAIWAELQKMVKGFSIGVTVHDEEWVRPPYGKPERIITDASLREVSLLVGDHKPALHVLNSERAIDDGEAALFTEISRTEYNGDDSAARWAKAKLAIHQARGVVMAHELDRQWN